MQVYSGLPVNDLNSNAGVLSDERLRELHLRGHFLELCDRLLELLTRRGILSDGSDELDRVELCLIIKVVQQLDDLVQFVQVVDLNLALLELGKGSEGTH